MNTAEYIRECDAVFSDKLVRLANKLAEGKNRLICLSGPTCSGKTTAAAMLSKELSRNGTRVHTVSLDDFYFDREHLHMLSEQRGDGEIDYDSEDTLDFDELRSFVSSALAGGKALCPVFDFKTGNREGFRAIDAHEHDIFIFEGIQAIYPGVRELLLPYGCVGVYISAVTPITQNGRLFLPDDIRLMRRLVRDFNFRCADAVFTFTLWRSVRANERKNIFPYIDLCEYKIDSTHAYEIGVLKPYLEKILSAVPKDSEYADITRSILEGVADIEPIDSSLIPEDSLYREFV